VLGKAARPDAWCNKSAPPFRAARAEVVPNRGPVTVDVLLTLPDDGYQYEVVEGSIGPHPVVALTSG
jgi:hypothetical protein